MAQLVLSVFVDGMMALLLILTIFYCWRLNLRIRVLQDSKSELAKIIKQFDESTQRATAGIAAVHEATSRISENIQHKIDKANYLADDLQFMIEKGSKMADRMDGGAPTARSSSSSRGGAARKSKVMDDPEMLTRRREKSGMDDAEGAGEADASAPSSLEAVLKRVSGRKSDAGGGDAATRRKRPGARIRSKSEQELFEALKSGGTEA